MLGSYTTVGAAISELAPAMGTGDRQEQLSILNDLRQRMYSWFRRRNHIQDIIMCFEVQEFVEDCNSCHKRYNGISLPYNMQNVEGIWENQIPLPLTEGWKTWSPGISSCPSVCSVRGEIESVNYATELDPCYDGGGVKIKFSTTSREDSGKVVTIKYTSPDGEKRTDRLKLDIDAPVPTEFKVNSKLLAGDISLPMDLCGEVLVQECSDSSKVLSKYNSKELVPSYRRLRLYGVTPGCTQINVKATRKYAPVSFDDDIVETDNLSFLYEGILWVVSRRKANRSQRDITDSRDRELELQQMLFGEEVRERPASIDRKVKSVIIPGRKKRMNRRRSLGYY